MPYNDDKFSIRTASKTHSFSLRSFSYPWNWEGIPGCMSVDEVLARGKTLSLINLAWIGAICPPQVVPLIERMKIGELVSALCNLRGYSHDFLVWLTNSTTMVFVIDDYFEATARQYKSDLPANLRAPLLSEFEALLRREMTDIYTVWCDLNTSLPCNKGKKWWFSGIADLGRRKTTVLTGPHDVVDTDFHDFLFKGVLVNCRNIFLELIPGSMKEYYVYRLFDVATIFYGNLVVAALNLSVSPKLKSELIRLSGKIALLCNDIISFEGEKESYTANAISVVQQGSQIGLEAAVDEVIQRHDALVEELDGLVHHWRLNSIAGRDEQTFINALLQLVRGNAFWGTITRRY